MVLSHALHLNNFYYIVWHQCSSFYDAQVHHQKFPIDSDAKFIWVKLQTQESHPVFVCSFYRPPNCEVEPLLSLSESLKEANHLAVILGGDFNLPHISWDNGYGQ